MILKTLLENLTNTEKTIEEAGKFFTAKSGLIKSSIYIVNDFIIYHVIVPGTKNGASYDVVIEVKTNNLKSDDDLLERFEVMVFSNSPSFIYGLYDKYNKDKSLCTWLISKFGTIPESRSTPTSKTSSVLDKSLYLAIRHLSESGKLKISIAKTTGKRISNKNIIFNKIRSKEQIFQTTHIDQVPDINKKQYKIDLKSSNPSSKKKSKMDSLTIPSTKSTKKTSVTKSTKKISNIKSMKKI